MYTPSINAFGNAPQPPASQPARASETENVRPRPDGGADAAPDASVRPAEDKVSVSEAAAVASAVRGEAETSASMPESGIAERIREAIEEVQNRATSVQFQIEMENHEVIVKIINRESGDTIREIPPEEVRRMQENLRELRGVLLEEVS